jgi:hypothetical protein
VRLGLLFAPALTSLVLLLACAPARAQGWRIFPFPEYGFAVQFPAEPTVTKDVYRTSEGVTAPATVFTTLKDNVVFTVTVGDFSKTAADGDAVINDALKAAALQGEIKLDVDARINRQYGHELSVKGRDGSYSMWALFFFNHRFYQLVGRAAAPDAESRTGQTVRFQQSLQFPGI